MENCKTHTFCKRLNPRIFSVIEIPFLSVLDSGSWKLLGIDNMVLNEHFSYPYSWHMSKACIFTSQDRNLLLDVRLPFAFCIMMTNPTKMELGTVLLKYRIIQSVKIIHALVNIDNDLFSFALFYDLWYSVLEELFS